MQGVKGWLTGGLWRHPDFLRLWFSQSTSRIGNQITFVALPLTAVLVLDATPAQMGILTALAGVPSLIVGFFVGAWVDRNHPRVILIAVDWVHAIVILAVPVAHFLDVLSLGLLYFVAFSMGLLGLLFEVSYRSYLPALVTEKQLIEANSKFELGRSGAELAGPGLGGVLVQAFSAPVALIGDAVSFLFSAVLLHSIRRREPVRKRDSSEQTLFSDALEGIKMAWKTRYVRPLIVAGVTIMFFSSAIEAVFFIFVSEELGVSPGFIGVIFAVGGVGVILGASMAQRITTKIGLGTAIVLSILLLAIADMTLPLATGSRLSIVVILSAGQLVFGFGLALWNVSQVSLRQAAAPERFQGRLNASFQVAVLSAIPIGALAGGFSGELFSLRTTLYIAIAGEASAVLWLIAGSYLRLRTLPSIEGETE